MLSLIPDNFQESFAMTEGSENGQGQHVFGELQQRGEIELITGATEPQSRRCEAFMASTGLPKICAKTLNIC